MLGKGGERREKGSAGQSEGLGAQKSSAAEEKKTGEFPSNFTFLRNKVIPLLPRLSLSLSLSFLRIPQIHFKVVLLFAQDRVTLAY